MAGPLRISFNISRISRPLSRLDAFLGAHDALIRRVLLAAAVAFPAAALAAAVLVRSGGVDFGARSGAAATFLVWYVAPLFLAAPLWLRERLHVTGRTHALDAAVTVLAFARFVSGGLLPFSGHMLFLSYSALTPPATRGYRVLALALLIETTIFKLWIWRDPRSWGLGLVLGLLAAASLRMGRDASHRPDDRISADRETSSS